MRHSATHFEQVPIEIVETVLRHDATLEKTRRNRGYRFRDRNRNPRRISRGSRRSCRPKDKDEGDDSDSVRAI
jgi:hypothetical protein